MKKWDPGVRIHYSMRTHDTVGNQSPRRHHRKAQNPRRTQNPRRVQNSVRIQHNKRIQDSSSTQDPKKIYFDRRIKDPRRALLYRPRIHDAGSRYLIFL